MSTVRAAVYRNGVFSDPAGFAVPPAGSPPSPLGKGVPRSLQGRAPAVLQCAAAEVNPAAGGKLELPGVARVVIPPGALPAGRPVLVRLLALEPPPELPGAGQPVGPVVWLRCRGLSAPLFNQPVELTFTAGAAEPGAVKVYALEGEVRRPEPLPAQAAGGTPVTAAGQWLAFSGVPVPARVTGSAIIVPINRPGWFVAVR